MVPIPQYPLYSAALTLNQGQLLPYYLDEDNGWSCNAETLEKSIQQSLDHGFVPRGIILINPGNPTGQVLAREDLEDVARLCYEYNMVIVADEVYQENIYSDRPFISMRKVLHEMGDPYSDHIELISLHSTSKGLLGECGLRGGYYEIHNMGDKAKEIFYKLKSIELCSNTIGQLACELMVNPPKRGRESDACNELYESQVGKIRKELGEKAKMLSRTLGEMDNITCTNIDGAMYGFPRLHFSDKFMFEASQMGQQPDFLYCMDMLENTGIMTVPGSGFGQVPGTYHFRITNLVTPNDRMEQVLERLRDFNNEWHSKH